MEKVPIAVIAVLVKKDGKILMGKRKKHPAKWGLPGGKIEFGEDLEKSVSREVDEEVGIKVKNLRFGTVTNEIFDEIDKHYVTITMTADYDSGEVVLKEPEKCEVWEWVDWNDLPEPLSLLILNLKKQDFSPF